VDRMVQERLLVGLNLGKGMTYLVLSAVLFLGFPPTAIEMGQIGSHQPSPPFQIQVSKPLQWVGDCLSVTVDRLNLSVAPLYLPQRGLYIALLAKTARINNSEMTGGEAWLPLYGPTDMVSWDATSLAPGATQREEHCLKPSVHVLSMKRETDRQLPVRGRLKILAYYFLSEEEWLKHKAQRGGLDHVPADQSEKVSLVDPHWVIIETLIPCHGDGCAQGCDNPPLILEDEKVTVPYVPLKDWIDRGRAIDKGLANKFPPCPQDSFPP
jgi:hypothetical protein